MAIEKETNNKTKSTKKTTTTKKTATATKTTKPTTRKTTTPKNTTKINQVVEQKVENKDNNYVLTVIGIIVLVIVAIIIFRLTYAYFTTTIDDKNPDNKDVVVQTADLLVRYVDGGSNIELNSKIEPGNTITKKFSVVNDGNDTGYYAIALQKLENTFSVVCPSEDEPNKGELKFTLLSVDSSDNELATLSTGTLPCTESPISYTIYSQDGVEKNKTNNYKLVIEYKNLTDVDQTDNMDKGKLEALINIIEVEDEQRTQTNQYSN